MHANSARKKQSDDQMQVLKTQLDTGVITQEEYDTMVKVYKKSHTLDRELDKWAAVKKVLGKLNVRRLWRKRSLEQDISDAAVELALSCRAAERRFLLDSSRGLSQTWPLARA